MKISFRQSGGFAGLSRRCELDTSLLPPDEAFTLDALVQQSAIHGTFNQKSTLVRDANQYEIVIERDDAVDRVSVDDPSITPALRPLIRFLQQRATPAPR